MRGKGMGGKGMGGQGNGRQGNGRQGNGRARLTLPWPYKRRTITTGGTWSVVRIGWLRILVVSVCTVALLLQTVVSSGALQNCRCECAMLGHRAVPKSTAQGCVCCAKDKPAQPCCEACGKMEHASPPTSAASCCSDRPSDGTPCRCWSHRHESQVAEPCRDRIQRHAVTLVGWVEPQWTTTVDSVRSLEVRSVFRPPGVRLQSLLCEWLI